MSQGGIVWRAMVWVVRRGQRGRPSGGRLVYVHRDGSVHDLGAFTPEELASLHRAVDAAYRLSHSRERTYLAPIRGVSGRLLEGVRRLPRVTTQDKSSRS